MEESKIFVINEQGKKLEADILLHYVDKNNNKEYVLYTYHELDEQEMETLHASVLVKEDGKYKLEKITDEEWLMVKEVMREIIRNEEGR